jgi:hypothetical protein
VKSEIHEKTPIREEGLLERQNGLRPDMAFDRRTNEGKVKENVEFSSPDGPISYGGDTLENVYERKISKYQELAKEVSAITGQQVNVTGIVVSSMGGVYAPSLRALRRMLNCRQSGLPKLGKRMSEAAILGSMAIWRIIVPNMERGVTHGKGDEVIQEEAQNAEQQDLREDKGGGEEEDEERQDDGNRRRQGDGNRRRQGEIGQAMEEEGQQMEDDEEGQGRDEEHIEGRRVGLVEEPISDEDL